MGNIQGAEAAEDRRKILKDLFSANLGCLGASAIGFSFQRV